VATQRRSLDTVRFQHCIQQDFAVSNLPQTTPTNRLPMCRLRMHNMTSQSRFCACSNFFFFFPFPPDFVCSTIHPRPPMRFPMHLMSRIRSTNTIASLDEHRPPHLPPNHATTSAPVAVCIPSLPCHPCVPPCMPAPKPRTRMTHARPVELGVFVWVSPFFVFVFYYFFFFFFSPVRLCTLLTHIRTPSSRAPTLAWPEGKTVAPSQGLDDGDGPRCITRPCPAHGFCARLAVGMRLTTLFDPQRDLELAVA